MPRTPGPPSSDSAKFVALEARVANAQAGRGVASRFRQLRRGTPDWDDVNRDGCDAAVHEYEGPLGRGYAIECWAVDGATTWRRVAQFGPETRREQGWHVVEGGG